eukprot:403358356
MKGRQQKNKKAPITNTYKQNLNQTSDDEHDDELHNEEDLEYEIKIFPSKWYEDSRVPRLRSLKQFEQAFESDGKHTIIELYDPKCSYCYEFMEDYHKLYYYFAKNYGTDQIQFLMMDGTIHGFDKYLTKFQINHCPYLIYISPNNNREMKIASRYQGEIMAYQGVKDWILETIPDLILKDDLEDNDDNQDENIDDDIEQDSIDEDDMIELTQEELESKKWRDSDFHQQSIIIKKEKDRQREEKIKAQKEQLQAKKQQQAEEKRLKEEEKKKKEEEAMKQSEILQQRRIERTAQYEKEKEEVRLKKLEERKNRDPKDNVINLGEAIANARLRENPNYFLNQQMGMNVHEPGVNNINLSKISQQVHNHGDSGNANQQQHKHENIMNKADYKKLYDFNIGPQDTHVTNDNKQRFNKLLSLVNTFQDTYQQKVNSVKSQEQDLLKIFQEFNNKTNNIQDIMVDNKGVYRLFGVYMLLGFIIGFVMTSVLLRLIIGSVKALTRQQIMNRMNRSGSGLKTFKEDQEEGGSRYPNEEIILQSGDSNLSSRRK